MDQEPRCDQPALSPITLRWREVFISIGFGVVAMGVYMAIGRLADAPHEVRMPDWVPFLPWLAIPYLLQLVVSGFLILALPDRGLQRACLVAILIAFACTCAIWLLYPTIMHRPAAPDAWWATSWRHMTAIDRPTNILPCGHILLPVITTWGLARARPRWLWWVIPFQVLGAIAIITTWQHRPVDVAIGAGIALGAGWWAGVGRVPRTAPTI